MLRFQSEFRRRVSLTDVVSVKGPPIAVLGVKGAISCQKLFAPWYIRLAGMMLFWKAQRPAPVLGFPVVGSKTIPCCNGTFGPGPAAVLVQTVMGLPAVSNS